MILTTLESVPGKSISQHLGLVQGSTVRAKHAGRDLMAGLKNIPFRRIQIRVLELSWLAIYHWLDFMIFFLY